jgi:hypothetical protein
MYKLRLLFFLLPFTLFCQSNYITDKEGDLFKIVSSIYIESQNPVESYQNCVQISDKYYQKLFSISSLDSTFTRIEQSKIKELIRLSFETRLNIRKHLALYESSLDSSGVCLLKVQNLNRALRYLEDYLIESLSKDSTGYKMLVGEEPVLLTNKNFKFNTYNDLKSGDLILSRGNAFTSSAIARIGIKDAQFSHLSLVYKNDLGELFTIESHIEIGAVVAPLKIHLNQNNARAVIFRFEDQDLAHEAAKYMYNKVKAQSDKGKNIPYDFGMDYKDSEELFCSEVIYDGFKSVSSGKVDVPIHKTYFDYSLIPFLNKLGVTINNQNYKEFKTFSPGDIELDHRFSLIAEWRNPNKLKDSRTKDAILTKMFEWIDEENYRFKPGFKISVFSNLSWVLRRTPIIKNSLDEKFPLNMNVKQLKLFLVLDKVGEIIQDEVNTYQKIIEHPIPPKDLFEFIEKLKMKDLETYKLKRSKSLFHRWFKPNI